MALIQNWEEKKKTQRLEIFQASNLVLTHKQTLFLERARV